MASEQASWARHACLDCTMESSAHHWAHPYLPSRAFCLITPALQRLPLPCNASARRPQWAAKLLDPASGRGVEFYTTAPGLIVYTGNW